MHLPVGPYRSPGAPHWGAPDPSGRAGAVGPARLDRFRLHRDLGPGDGPAYAAARLAALEELALLLHHHSGPAWRPLGPFAIPHGRTAGSGPGSRPRVAGRVVAVAADPGDPRHLLAAGGGVWESRDGGRTWAPRTDDQPTAAVGAVAFAPGDPRVAYAGTGQGEALAALGVGLLRSGDGGATWRALVARELLGAGFHDLLVDPGDPGRLLAATTAGLWASADGGHSWEPRLAGRSWSVSAGGGPGEPGWAGGELLAGGEHGLHRSEDGGATWRPVPLAAAPGGFDRVAVAHGPGGQLAYVFAAGDGVGHLWRREPARRGLPPGEAPGRPPQPPGLAQLGLRGRPRPPRGCLAGRRRPPPGGPRPRRPLVMGRPDGPAGRRQPPVGPARGGVRARRPAGPVRGQRGRAVPLARRRALLALAGHRPGRGRGRPPGRPRGLAAGRGRRARDPALRRRRGLVPGGVGRPGGDRRR